MAARQHDNETGSSSRKRLRLGDASSPISNHQVSSVGKWDNWASSGSPHSHGHGSTSDSISLSGSGSESGSQKASPTPEIINFPVSLTLAMPKLGALSSSSTVLNTPPVMPGVHGELRPLLLRPSLNVVEEHHSPTSAVVTAASGINLASWQIQDFDGLGAGFDGSLSGLSDLTANYVK